jgi:hypothetical protein
LQRFHNKPDATVEDAYDYGLFLIDMLLNKNGKSLQEDFPMLPMWHQEWANIAGNRFVREQLDFDPVAQSEQAAQAVAHMNPEQLVAFHRIMQSVETGAGTTFFLNGPGGTGKTFVYGAIAKAIRGQGKIVLCVASSGIAALLLDGGQTAHSCFGIPLEIDETSLCSITKRHAKAELIQQAVAIIRDEAPMQHKHCMEAVDRTCRDLRNSNEHFGGLTVVFGGDFRQILPVIIKGRREDIVAACIQHSFIWRTIEVLHLRQNM